MKEEFIKKLEQEAIDKYRDEESEVAQEERDREQSEIERMLKGYFLVGIGGGFILGLLIGVLI